MVYCFGDGDPLSALGLPELLAQLILLTREDLEIAGQSLVFAPIAVIDRLKLLRGDLGLMLSHHDEVLIKPVIRVLKP